MSLTNTPFVILLNFSLVVLFFHVTQTKIILDVFFPPLDPVFCVTNYPPKLATDSNQDVLAQHLWFRNPGTAQPGACASRSLTELRSTSRLGL